MSSLLEKTDSFVAELLEKQLPSTCIYHNQVHARRVCKSTKEIAEHSNLSDADTEAILVAALLHDIGYIEGYENHEENSIKIATPFLESEGVSA
ncbi:MAG: putative nucleotidyltransferase with HDIG domain, partial [Dokdonia sp.]